MKYKEFQIYNIKSKCKILLNSINEMNQTKEKSRTKIRTRPIVVVW